MCNIVKQGYYERKLLRYLDLVKDCIANGRNTAVSLAAVS